MNDDANKWHSRFVELAEHIAHWSKDPSTKVGAVIVRPDKTIASVGYNGFPRGVEDRASRLANEAREAEKYPRTVHAELNAILAAREPLHGFTLYVAPLPPCAHCAGAIIQAGISYVYFSVGTMSEHWHKQYELSKSMFDEAGVVVYLIP